MPPRSSSPICERSLDLTLIGIGRRDIPQCSSKHFHMEAFYRTFSGGQRPSKEGITIEGIATFPAGYQSDRRYPFLVLPHGGPEGRSEEHTSELSHRCIS